MSATRSASLRAMLVAAAAALAVAAVGSTLTRVGPWYRSLAKPAWTPPDPAFGVIWTVIFALAAIAGVSAWRAAPGERAREAVIGLFAVNGFLNILWSLIFFTLQRPDWALVEAAGLWLSVAALVIVLGRLSRRAGVLLVPYLIWVSLAVLLNYQVTRLNGPFG